MQATPNLIQGELHAIDKKCLPGSHRYSKQFYPSKFIKRFERHLKNKYPKLKIDVVEDGTDYTVYLYQK